MKTMFFTQEDEAPMQEPVCRHCGTSENVRNVSPRKYACDICEPLDDDFQENIVDEEDVPLGI